ncbi:MAG: DNA repair protein RadC [Oscillospiraceae bacterium]|nr:DNA repair protein RadC [Oscillospiraceae bacterium]
MDKDLHAGHRSRLRSQFTKGGLDPMSDVNVLELLLFYTIPRRDVNPIAHALLNHFGTLSGVFEAPLEELQKVPGVSEATAIHLHLVPQAARRYLLDQQSRVRLLRTPEQLGEYLMPFFFAQRTEHVYLLCLDAMCKPMGVRLLAQGEINSAAVTPRKVVETALSVGATSVVLAHNHPAGVALPSQDDLDLTEKIFRALDAVDVFLADHLIFADSDFLSLAEDGLITKLLEEHHGL